LGYWPFRACFEVAQRQSAKSERSARVRLTLGATGKVLGARSLGKASEPEYARCILARARSLDFTPGFTRKLDVELSIKEWPGHAPVPPRAPSDMPPLRLSPEAVASFEQLSPALSACYETALASDAKLWGRIAFKLELDTQGAIVRATPVETRFPSPEMSECARRAVLGARIPSVAVSELTFAFRLGQGAPPVPPSPEGAPPSVGPEPLSPLPAPAAPPEPSPPAPH
jgi:hypothetical protein